MVGRSDAAAADGSVGKGGSGFVPGASGGRTSHMAAEAAKAGARATEFSGDRSKEKDVRSSNFVAAKAVADAVRTSLGPKGMDKMIQSGNGEVVITNDGATILKQMDVVHPAAKMVRSVRCHSLGRSRAG